MGIADGISAVSLIAGGDGNRAVDRGQCAVGAGIGGENSPAIGGDGGIDIGGFAVGAEQIGGADVVRTVDAQHPGHRPHRGRIDGLHVIGRQRALLSIDAGILDNYIASVGGNYPGADHAMGGDIDVVQN
ncbi:MAG: hypothetical protein H6Q67_1692 [Firmicutes bacterium]|nr:hypothetical protein [Bacillota bacterium]